MTADDPPDDPPKKGKGVAWAVVNPISLGEELGKQHGEYVREYERARTTGDNLKKAIQEKWDRTYPSGIEGMRWVFNVLNGRVLYASVPFREIKALRALGGANAFPSVGLAAQQGPRQAASEPGLELKPLIAEEEKATLLKALTVSEWLTFQEQEIYKRELSTAERLLEGFRFARFVDKDKTSNQPDKPASQPPRPAGQMIRRRRIGSSI